MTRPERSTSTRLRATLLDTVPARPLRQVVLTVSERSVDGAGVWPADLALLTRLPHLEQIDIVATHATIAAGLLDRLEKFMPGFEEGELSPDPDETIDHSNRPALVVPSDGQRFTVSRDREDELSSIAARVKTAGGLNLDRRAVVFKRPLPYVYLARDVFADAGIPYQTFDALPLAAEPYAAALDLVFEFVTSNFTREPVVALLARRTSRSRSMVQPIRSIRRCRVESRAERRRLLRRRRSSCGHSPSRESGRRRQAAVGCRRGAAGARGRKRVRRVQLDALLAFLDAHDRIPPVGDPLRERHLRARRAVLSAIHGLRRAHAVSGRLAGRARRRWRR